MRLFSFSIVYVAHSDYRLAPRAHIVQVNFRPVRQLRPMFSILVVMPTPPLAHLSTLTLCRMLSLKFHVSKCGILQDHGKI